MDTFSPAHQPDEGYSEDPLNPSVHQSLTASLATLGATADLPSWLASNASALPLSVKKELTLTLLDDLPTSAIAEIVHRLNPRLYIDFVQYLPAEICLKVLGCLDPVSLVAVAQTCRAWYELALDRKLWERLYHLEGWKAIPGELESAEAEINAGVNNSIGNLPRVHNANGPGNRFQAARSDDQDTEMSDAGRPQAIPSGGSTLGGGSSVFGSPGPSFSCNAPRVAPIGNDAAMDVSFTSDSSIAKGKGIDRRRFGSPDVVRTKRKEPGGMPEPSFPPTLSKDNPILPMKSISWVWDVNNARYRINWKYLYNMRRRLESNWELGKYTTFQLPHPHYPEEGHQECVYTLQFDAHYLVSGSRDQTMRIWDIRTRRLVRPPLIGHSGSVLCLQFDASPEEDLLVSGSSDSNVFIWKFSTGELIQVISKAHRESVLNVRFDKRILVTSSKDKTIKIFNRRPLRFGELGYTTSDVAFGPAVKSVKHYGYEPDLAQELPLKEPYTMIGRLEGHGAAVNAIQVMDRTIVSGSGDRHIKVWDWPDQICTQTIPAHDKGIACVEFDGRRIVSGSSDYEVCIFDAPTGLKVAQLRGHAQLVRTVQAGFGDLPYSRFEDEAEAKVVDAEYFKAVEAGEISHDGERGNRRVRRVNAGSSRPIDVQAYGAKVPPGGGGGRKYGRIVSGSYDQSIIIWRRDKEGVWKPTHHLRQEEAAAAAQRHMPPSVPQPVPQPFAGQLQSNMPLHRPGRHSDQSPPQPQIRSNGPTAVAGQMNADLSGENPASSGTLMSLIDQVVHLGPQALEQALMSFPAMLSHHAYLQSVIERKQSPVERARLRRAVIASLASSQTGPASRPRTTGSSSAILHDTAAAASFVAGPDGRAGPRAPGSAASGHADEEAVLSTQGAPATTTGASASLAAAGTFGPMMANTRMPFPAPLPASAQPVPMPIFPPAHAAPLLNPHQPHIAAAENSPARIFKLQFDARKIVCCSQAPVIVGWDFCNGDLELEETARFFATVD